MVAVISPNSGETEVYSLIIDECQKECIFLDYADLEMSIGNVEQCREIDGKFQELVNNPEVLLESHS